MKRIILIFSILILISVPVDADLNLLGQGTSTHGTYNLIYDTDRDITWYDYANTHDIWQNQVDWADALSVTFGSNTYTDWRLPTAMNNDGTGPNYGWHHKGSEMGHLFYKELGNTPLTYLANTGDFQSLTIQAYWSGTLYAPDNDYAWYFSFYDGLSTYNSLKDSTNFLALAVRDGMAVVSPPVVPEPLSSILFITGGTLLAGQRLLRKKRLYKERIMYIAPGIDVSEWRNLNLTVDNGNWEKATEIFKQRVTARYLEPVDLLISGDEKRPPAERRYGFTILAIDCLLVEMLQSFKEGITDSTGQTKDLFKRFLTESKYFGHHFNKDQAEKFYYDFRCGIIHQAEVKGESLLWSVGLLKGERIDGIPYINRTRFHEGIKSEIELYIEQLKNKEHSSLREKFIEKMNYIARNENK